MKQEKYFLPQEIRMLAGYYFEYFSILADTSVPSRHKLLFQMAVDNLAADGGRLMEIVSEEDCFETQFKWNPGIYKL